MSFVVVIPEAEREILRGGGIIPGGFFREAGASGAEGGRILLWPHELDYGAGTVEEGRPVDLAEFFGLGRSETPEEKRAKERMLVPVLRLPVVHVVFLDEREGAGGYARFRTFSEIAAWAKRLERAMETRFPRESGFGGLPRALVLVARGEQVKATEQELGEFASCVGTGRLFTSCYYLDYNLRMGTDGDLYHADDVWDVLLGRLLLAFALSQEKGGDGHARPYFGEAGVKVWRSADCRAGLVPAAESAAIVQAVGEASAKLREHLEADETADVEEATFPDADAVKTQMDEALGPLFPAGRPPEPWRRRPPWGWSDFRAPECLAKTRDDDGGRWHAALAAVKKSFPGWKRTRKLPAIEKEVSDVYKGVHASVANLTPQIRRLLRRLRESDAAGDPVDNWLAMERAERKRMAILGDMARDTTEFERARARYVGFGLGFFVCAAVSLALGWIGYRVAAAVVPLFGLPAAMKIPLALLAFAFMAAGSLAATLLTTVCHWRAGERGMKELVRESLAADEELANRDKEARTIAAEGMAAEDASRIRASRFRAWMLLERLQTMVETEISLPLAQGRPGGAGGVAGGRDGKADGEAAGREGVRAAFLRETRTEFGPYDLPNNSVIRTIIASGEKKWREEAFSAVWRRLSEEDDRLAGHYPARRVVPELRRVASGYVESVRKSLRTAAVEQVGTLRAAVEEWAGDFDRVNIHHYASAALTGGNVAERTAIPPMVFYDRKAVGGNLAVSDTGTPYGRYGRRASEGLEQTELLGLMYQEFRVKFGSDPTTGNLTLQVVSDAG